MLHAALKITWPAISEVSDAGAPQDIQKKIAHIACNIQGVQDIHRVRTRYISTSILVDMHIVVDGSISVREGHAIADEVEAQIINGLPIVLGAEIHVDPMDLKGAS